MKVMARDDPSFSIVFTWNAPIFRTRRPNSSDSWTSRFVKGIRSFSGQEANRGNLQWQDLVRDWKR